VGGKNEKPTIGHKHYLGAQFILCLSSIDKLLRIDVDKNVLWRGASSGGRIKVDKPDLFDSSIPEGGVSGNIDVMLGDQDQPKNDYLVSLFKGVASAFRGVTSVVLRQVYLGNSPYLRSWAFKVQRIYKIDGGPQWYPERAGISVSGMEVGDAGIYIAMDASISMNGGRMQRQKDAVVGLLESIRDDSSAPNDIHIVTWDDSPIASIERRDCTDDDYTDLIDWVSNLSNATTGSTNFAAAFDGLYEFYTGSPYDPSFVGDIMSSLVAGRFGDLLDIDSSGGGTELKRRIVIFSTDGFPSTDTDFDDALTLTGQLENLEIFCVNIDNPDTQYTEILDNTQGDGVPVVDSSNPDALVDAFRGALSSGRDMNPSHILREAIIAKDTGGYGDDYIIGDSFRAAADLFYSEGFGLSFIWKSDLSRSDFMRSVEAHIDAVTYEHRKTGKWEIKPIRADYDKALLPVFDRSNIMDWTNLSLPTDKSSLPNQITIEYMDRIKDEIAALTVSNPVRVAQAGAIISKTIKYHGIHGVALASRVAARDLLVASSLIRSGTIRVTDLPVYLNRGDPILLNEHDLGIVDMVARITKIVDGDGRDNSVLVDWVEDKFDLPSQAYVVVDPPVIGDVTNYPQPAKYRMVEESPYYEMVKRVGQVETDLLLDDDQTIGFLNVSCESPTPDAISALISVHDGTDFATTGAADFMVVSEVLSSLTRRADQTKVAIRSTPDLAFVRVGSIASIGSEIVRVDAIDNGLDMFALDDVFSVSDVFADGAILTIGRGCLDTVPQPHPAGSQVMFWGDVASSDRVERFQFESVQVKLLTKTMRGTLKVGAAPTDIVIFDSRAIRPFPVGDLRINGEYRDTIAAGPLSITWTGRDRTLQTTSIVEDHTFGNIGPEAGTTYVVHIAAVDDAGGEVLVLDDVDKGAAMSHTFDLDDYQYDIFLSPDVFAMPDAFGTILPVETAAIKIEVRSFRDGMQCWQSPSVYAILFRPPEILALGSPDEIEFLAPTNVTLTEV